MPEQLILRGVRSQTLIKVILSSACEFSSVTLGFQDKLVLQLSCIPVGCNVADLTGCPYTEE